MHIVISSLFLLLHHCVVLWLFFMAVLYSCRQLLLREMHLLHPCHVCVCTVLLRIPLYVLSRGQPHANLQCQISVSDFSVQYCHQHSQSHSTLVSRRNTPSFHYFISKPKSTHLFQRFCNVCLGPTAWRQQMQSNIKPTDLLDRHQVQLSAHLKWNWNKTV